MDVKISTLTFPVGCEQALFFCQNEQR